MRISAAAVAAPAALLALTACGSTSSPSRPVTRPAATAGPVETPAPVAPDPSAYSVMVRTTSKQCFGTAGCLVDVALGLNLLDSSASGVAADLTIRVTGDESGPIIQTISLGADGKYRSPVVSMSTRSGRVKVRAEVTSVVVGQ